MKGSSGINAEYGESCELMENGTGSAMQDPEVATTCGTTDFDRKICKFSCKLDKSTEVADSCNSSASCDGNDGSETSYSNDGNDSEGHDTESDNDTEGQDSDSNTEEEDETQPQIKIAKLPNGWIRGGSNPRKFEMGLDEGKKLRIVVRAEHVGTTDIKFDTNLKKSNFQPQQAAPAYILSLKLPGRFFFLLFHY
eukprot:TRINITY_DN4562_c0_g1_i8.p1 TRINITY_DN4562_c0_g1~~TRINITY_DN4562_c0_g1_i8.p1  ORF type:complete len:195 (+),score=54.33 TRINITY_DN4562_c0_g1_i8:686-1270(+)